jgi:phytanoyl-CoA hydroxylase
MIVEGGEARDSMTIGKAHLARLEEQGFCVLEGLFGADEMDALARHVQRAYLTYEERLHARGAEDGISRPGEIAFTPNLARDDREMARFSVRPELVSVAAELLGEDVDLYWDQLVYKAPETRRDFPWHQDDAYGRVTPSPTLTLWIALNDATTENGCIHVLPGSHRRGFVPHEQGPHGWFCHSNDDPDQGVPVPVRSGSVLVFWSLTVHKSGPNLSDDLRRAYIVQYSKAGLRDATSGEPIDTVPVLRDGRVLAPV